MWTTLWQKRLFFSGNGVHSYLYIFKNWQWLEKSVFQTARAELSLFSISPFRCTKHNHSQSARVSKTPGIWKEHACSSQFLSEGRMSRTKAAPWLFYPVPRSTDSRKKIIPFLLKDKIILFCPATKTGKKKKAEKYALHPAIKLHMKW